MDLTQYSICLLYTSYSYKITVEVNDGAIIGTIVTVDKETGKVKAVLPEGKEILPANRIVVTVKDSSGKPVKGVEVEVCLLYTSRCV